MTVNIYDNARSQDVLDNTVRISAGPHAGPLALHPRWTLPPVQRPRFRYVRLTPIA